MLRPVGCRGGQRSNYMTRADASSELTVASNHNDKARGSRRIGEQLHDESRCFQMACGGRTEEGKYVPTVWPVSTRQEQMFSGGKTDEDNVALSLIHI